MDKREGRILLVQFDAGLSGSSISGLMLADGLREAGWEIHVAFGADGPIVPRYRANGHEVAIVPHKNWLRSRNPLRLVRNLIRERPAVHAFEGYLDALRPDLVYVNTGASLAGALAARRRGLPCVWHLRELLSDVGGELMTPPGTKPLVRAAIRACARRVVVNSEAVAHNVMGDAEGAFDRVPNAVDDAFFACRVSPIDARAALGLPAEGTILGVPGTLRPMKGHPFLFEALARLSGMGVGLTVAVTGAGESAYTERLRAMTRTLGIDAFVRFLGPVEDMPAFYRACDLVCVPSVAEPFGRTVIEAFAVGVPVIASAVGGILEIVIHERTGLLVDYGNTEALAASVARLGDDPELRRALSREAGRQARAEYRAVVYQARIARIVAGVLGPTPDGVLLAGSPRGVLVR